MNRAVLLTLLLAACGSRAAGTHKDSGARDSRAADAGARDQGAHDALPIGCAGNSGCASTEYCRFDKGCAFTGAALGSCVAKPQGCDLLHAPVCGCDGKTYGNACAAAREGVNVAAPGECAAGQLTLRTDKQSYGAGDKVTLTLHNGSSTTVYVDICTAFFHEHFEAGAWADKGPDAICGTGGLAQPLEPGKAVTRVYTLGGGRWRFSIPVATGCSAGGPFSAPPCAKLERLTSAEITVLPTSQSCLDLDAKYRSSIDGALKCDVRLSRTQCDKSIADGLHCPCTLFVEDTSALDALKQQWDDALCNNASLPPCVPQPCPRPGPLTCIADRCQ